MAVTARTMVSSNTRAARPRMFPTIVKEKTFAADAGAAAVTLAPGTALAYNTSTNLWVQWANGGANGTGTIRGFVADPGVTIFATGGGEAIGPVMLEGEIHYADIIAPGGTLAQLKTQLQSGALRDQGIIIEGLDKVY